MLPKVERNKSDCSVQLGHHECVTTCHEMINLSFGMVFSNSVS